MIDDDEEKRSQETREDGAQKGEKEKRGDLGIDSSSFIVTIPFRPTSNSLILYFLTKRYSFISL